ncbi:MAG: hypothetical protein LW724_08440 [Planctomycetaceae bacterium]|jgi:hypothetical protein|nr:hypothetical protein [Planctomycetaceae bacterium]
MDSGSGTWGSGMEVLPGKPAGGKLGMTPPSDAIVSESTTIGFANTAEYADASTSGRVLVTRASRWAMAIVKTISNPVNVVAAAMNAYRDIYR